MIETARMELNGTMGDW